MSDITNPRFINLSNEGLAKDSPNGENVTRLLKSDSKIIVILDANRCYYLFHNGKFSKAGYNGLREWGESVVRVMVPDANDLTEEFCKAYAEKQRMQFSIG